MYLVEDMGHGAMRFCGNWNACYLTTGNPAYKLSEQQEQGLSMGLVCISLGEAGVLAGTVKGKIEKVRPTGGGFV